MLEATLEGTLSGLGHAMVQPGLPPERDAEASQFQAKAAGQRTYMAIGCDVCMRHRLKGPGRHLPGHDDQRRVEPHHHDHGNAINIAGQVQRKGIRDLRQSGLLKVRRGMTSLEEVEACSNE